MSSKKRHHNKKYYIFKGENSSFIPLNKFNILSNFISSNKTERKNNNNSNIIINVFNNKKEFFNYKPKILDVSKINNSYTNTFDLNKNKKVKLAKSTNNKFEKLNLKNKNNEHSDYFMNSYTSKTKSNLGKKKLTYDYLKTDITPKKYYNLKKGSKLKNIQKINLLFPTKYNFKKNDSNYYDELFGSTSGLFKKYFSNFKYNTYEQIKEKNSNIALKPKNAQIKPEGIYNKISNESKNNINENKKRENDERKGPEEIHWYLVKSIQEGKKLKTKLDFL